MPPCHHHTGVKKPHGNTKHGWRHTKTYSAWANMRTIYRPLVCARWSLFALFLEDMGVKPDGRTLTRLDKDGGFSKDNCVWAGRVAGEHNPNYRHGHTKSPEYTVWSSMLGRTLNPNDKRYADYGGRGVGVCDRWLVPENFLKDMGSRPKGEMLERIDNNKGYAPDNCRWATAKDQARNKRNTVRIVFRGAPTTLMALAETLGLNYYTLYNWYSKNKNIDAAVAVQLETKKDMLNKNVPIPEQRENHKTVAGKMEIGDSCLFPNREKAKGLRQALKNLGRKSCIRKTERGFRIWRTE